MSAARVYVVTPRGGEPYRVTLVPENDGWTCEVRRGDEHWRFELAPGPEEGLVRVGTRPVRWRRHGERIVLNGEPHELVVETEAAHRLSAGRGGGAAAAGIVEIRAPMPGLVLDVEVEEGAEVEAGGGIAIIEAMKMENEITAPATGLVRGLSVRAGQVVERGDLLCRIEPAEAAP